MHTNFDTQHIDLAEGEGAIVFRSDGEVVGYINDVNSIDTPLSLNLAAVTNLYNPANIDLLQELAKRSGMGMGKVQMDQDEDDKTEAVPGPETKQ